MKLLSYIFLVFIRLILQESLNGYLTFAEHMLCSFSSISIPILLKKTQKTQTKSQLG